MERGRELRDPNYQELIDAINKINGLSEEEKQALCVKYEMIFHNQNNVPRFMQERGRFRLITRLSYDERFCFRTDIDYNNFDRHIPDINLAITVFYGRQLESRL